MKLTLLIRSIFILPVLFVISGCDKDNGNFSWLSEARYYITVTSNWKTPAFSVPASAHFTTFVGTVHNSEGSLWKEGTKASAGTEQLAEIGNGSQMLAEIDSLITNGKASSLILFLGPDLAGSRTATVYVNTNYSIVSFASMLGPTPDWFTGVSGISLYNKDKWITDTTFNLYVYDAGTEEGDVFSTSNAATAPQQNIQILTAAKATVLANGNSSLAPIATVRFRKQ